MSPRPFERPATLLLPDDAGLPAGSSLEGLWLPARGEEGERGGAIVAPPHPLMGGSMDSPVATEIGLAASDAGYASLRFNWRGVAGSAGQASGEADDADSDYRAALDFMRESVEGGLLACGYSWGSLAAARVCLNEPRVRKLVLVAPPAAMLDRESILAAGKPILIVAGDRDEYVPLEPLNQVIEGIDKVELAVLEDVDHFFMSGLRDLGARIRDWLGGA